VWLAGIVGKHGGKTVVSRETGEGMQFGGVIIEPHDIL